MVFVAFCADWCPFSRRLKPVFEEAANVWHRENPKSSVVWALVDSVAQANVADKYFVNKYPTMKVFINGELISKEYRSTRSVEALTAFVRQQLQISISEFASADQLSAALDKGKRNVVGYYHCRDCPEYQNFQASVASLLSPGFSRLQKAAALLREDCAFHSATGQALESVKGHSLVFKDPDTESDIQFSGNFADLEFVKQWLKDKCIPLVREVTFENVEELTEEGLPFLIFFRDPAKKEDDKFFSELVSGSASAVQCLGDARDPRPEGGRERAAGRRAQVRAPPEAPGQDQQGPARAGHRLLPAHVPLPRHGRAAEAGQAAPGECAAVERRPLQFVEDLHSGKLHKEFHETLDQRVADLQKTLDQQQAEEGGAPAQLQFDTTPKSSIFKELKPSGKRYSLLQKTEL